MLDNNTIDILRKKFSESYFFVRIFNHNGATYIWNDKTIYIKLLDINIKNVDLFVKTTIKVFKESIEKKYANMKSRLLSVIIPNYNNELTIKNTIDSILNSTYKDIEIIIVHTHHSSYNEEYFNQFKKSTKIFDRDTNFFSTKTKSDKVNQSTNRNGF